MRHGARLAGLAAAVLAAHGLLLSSVGGARPAAHRPSPWVARTLDAVLPAAQAMEAPPAGQPQAAPAQRAAAARPGVRPAAHNEAAAGVPPGGMLPDSAAAPASDAPVATRPASSRAANPGLQVAAADADAAVATPPHKASVRPMHFKVHPAATFHYRVVAASRGFELQGEGELEWKRDGEGYEARLTARAPLIRPREQRSTGRVTAQGVTPDRFSDRSRSEEAAHFQREANKISFSNNQPDVPLEPGAQDRLSIILQLGAILAGEPRRHPAGSTITIQTASTRGAEPWVFTVEGEEGLHLPGGELTGVKLVRNPREEHDTKVELWLAPGMDYAPVRLRLTQPNGDWVDQQWSGTDRG
ncbi:MULTISPECIES: DUF3108 domain-containing protein [Ramlibacter]|uniref:DUF3108 domain-containing protein n=1 Tax=Ramlibacter aquaticus TaxID=2780094 RepID=A0ABR9SBN2_9BURK|nr:MULTISPECIES: DUF3108 domain-containing protein [Ramlibacter]MBE7939756.1 DUF3108 domain-containing protein [Ramlibacter aquaticus]